MSLAVATDEIGGGSPGASPGLQIESAATRAHNLLHRALRQFWSMGKPDRLNSAGPLVGAGIAANALADPGREY